MLPKILKFLQRNLVPNRLAVAAVATAALATALAPAFTDIGLEGVAACCVATATFAGIVGKWLTGWQQYEKAIYTMDVNQHNVDLANQQLAAEVAAAQEVGGARRVPSVSLPR